MSDPLVYQLDDLVPDIDPGAYLAPNAIVIGRVTIAEGASVWFNAVVRADTEAITIGRDVNIQDGCALHADPGFPLILEDGVSLGHAAVVHGAHVGAGSLIGMGAVVLNGAKIGRSCLIAGGTVVRPGTEIPDGSLVAGVPGKIRRELTDDELASLVSTATNYRARIDRYRSGLTRIDHPGPAAS